MNLIQQLEKEQVAKLSAGKEIRISSRATPCWST